LVFILLSERLLLYVKQFSLNVGNLASDLHIDKFPGASVPPSTPRQRLDVK
jgi:hypothetical protein